MRQLANLPAPIVRETFATLCASLPPPISDLPEDRDARDEAAVQAVAALRPGNAFEARLAVQIVLADAHAKDCLRQAAQPGIEPKEVNRARAFACSLMRQMQSGLRALQRMQMERAKAQPVPAARVEPSAPVTDAVDAEAEAAHLAKLNALPASAALADMDLDALERLVNETGQIPPELLDPEQKPLAA